MMGVGPAGRPDTARPGSRGAGFVAVRVSAGGEVRVTGESADDPLLTRAQIGELLDMSPSAWSALVTQGIAPKADDPGDLSVSVYRRTPKWRLSTVEFYKLTHRPRRKRKPKGPDVT